MRQKLKWIDYGILIPTLLLIVIGIIMIYSAGSYTAIVNFGNQNHYLIRQSIFAVIALFLLAFVFFMNSKLLRQKKLMPFIIGLTIILLAVVLLIGDEVNGARAWINLGPFNIQPAEIAKLVIIWYLAYYFSKKQNRIVDDFKETIKYPLVLIGVMLLLILCQPDMGSIFIILAIIFVMLVTSGTSLKVVFSLTASVVGVCGLGLVILFSFGDKLPFVQTYQLERLVAFVHPFEHAQSSGLQLVNSYYALSRGGFLGVGLGSSVQKTGFLPEPQTDFIMAIIGEELGLLGVFIILGLVFFLIARIYRKVRHYHSSFNALFSIGIATMLLIQVCVNIGGMVGLLPITGVTFPFISYGGSSLMINCVAVGLVLNVDSNEARRNAYLKKKRSER